MKLRLPLLRLCLAAIFAVPSAGFASTQAGLDRLVFMAGTTTVDTQGRHWAYLAWQATEPEGMRSRVFAIYAKGGDANSGANYERRAIVAIQTDPIVIQPLLQRAAQIGQNLDQLNETVNNLFEKLMPDKNLPLADKLSAVIRGSLENPDHFKNLVLMARLHTAVGLCLGWGHAELIPGPIGTPTTFELRAYEPASDRDIGVLGRVTVRAGQPVLLPAPGAPVEVPDMSAKGDLNAKMRWATPDDLRRLSMLQHGFNIYRMPRAVAESAGYHIAPPTSAALYTLLQTDPTVHRLNHVPVLNPRDFTKAEAEDLVGDSTTFFFSDWNDRFNPFPNLPQGDFVNGAQFYYFLTARDLLGRDGRVSPGTLITICDRMPPRAPRQVRVVNHYEYGGGVSEQGLRVIWNQNENTPQDTTTDYYVYRWTSITQLHVHAGDPGFNRIAGPISHIAGSPTNSYLDVGAGAPSVALNAGQTFWYTVVAIDSGACPPEPNRSPHSAPSYGVLRDRVGPDGGGGRVEITCVSPNVNFVGSGPDVTETGLATNAYHYRLVTDRKGPRIIWTEYWYEIPGITTAAVPLGRHVFLPGQAQVAFDLALPKTNLPPNPYAIFHCRVGSLNGKVSETESSPPIMPIFMDGSVRPVRFSAGMNPIRTSPHGDCDVHDPHGDDDGTVDPICVTAMLTPGTREVKFYRRVEEGPLTLVCQKEATFGPGMTTLNCCDSTMPAQPSDICYFVQLFDEHGNAGPMQRIRCVKTAPNAPLPTPILSPVAALGTATNAQMRLEWFCPAYGVERFEVWIAGNLLPPAKDISPMLVLTNQIELGMPLPGILPQPTLMNFLTRRVGPRFGAGPTFSVDADVIVGNSYSIFVRPVGKDGSIGPRSNVEQFSWHVTPAVTVTNLAWPARSLPAITLTNFPGVLARLFRTNDLVFNPFPQQRFEGVGIRVGALNMGIYPSPATNAIDNTEDPMKHVYRSARDFGSLFPLVVYRAQVENADFPKVSSDVVQVTPLMEQIAFNREAIPAAGNGVVVYDPFIRLIPKNANTAEKNWELYLLDTQPVVEEASYQYFLVRLNAETREIAEVIPTNPVQIVPD